jgi:hypothetical protein
MVDVTDFSNLAPASVGAKRVHTTRAGDFSRGKIAILFVVLMAIVSIPILLHPLPPISDYVNHLARMHIIATINTDPDLARYYEIDWQVIPNLTMDLIVPVFERVMNVYLAGQVYAILSFALILSATVALHRQLYGRWSALPLIAFPLLYNHIFLVGTMNYVFGIGLALWALVAWVGLRERALALRLVVSSLFVLVLFFCHLFALGVYGLGLLAFELQRLWSAYARRRRLPDGHGATPGLPSLLLDFLSTGLPFLPVLPLLMMSPVRGLWDEYSWELAGKLDGLVDVIDVYSYGVALCLSASIAVATGLALRYRALSLHAFGLALLAVGAIAYVALPRVMFETYMVDQRLPISLVFMLVASVDVDFRHRIVRRGFAAALFLLLAVRAVEVESTWRQLSTGIESFRQSVQLLERGAKVLVAYAEPESGGDVGDFGLVHADCLAIIERSALATTAFTVVGKQILHARPDYRDRVDTEDGTPPAINELVRVATYSDTNREDYWRRWTSDYDYLYVLYTKANFENPDPTHLTKVFTGERFVLYRIEQSRLTEASKAMK